MEYILLSIITTCVIFFILTHLRPLTDKEINELGLKNRDKEITNYLSYHGQEISVDKEFKKRMDPKGKFYHINENLNNFPSLAAGFLKYKKHEWVIIGFEKDGFVQLMWINKGNNNQSVSIKLPIEQIINKCMRYDFSSVIMLHNHPNSNPKLYDCSNPSVQDFNSAKYYSNALIDNGINLIEFICERGRPHKYFTETSDDFLPLITFIQEIVPINGRSKYQNLILHINRIF